MNVSVAKCHSVRVTRRLTDKQYMFDCSLHQQTFEEVQFTKYLDITITNSLDWGQNISGITANATRSSGLFRPNLAFAPRHTKYDAYKTMVRSKLEYVAPILKLRLINLKNCRGRLLYGPSGGGEIREVWVIYRIIWNGHPWRHVGRSPS